jgi:hypothetical protein
MAKGGKSKYVKTITHRENKLFSQLGNTNLCSFGQAKEHCNINRDRLDKLQNSGYVKLNHVFVNGQRVGVVQLADKGKNYVRNNLENTNFYRGNLGEAKHNLKLTNAYYKILNEHPDAKWLNESNLRQLYPEKLINNKDCVDGMVILPNGDKFAVEVIGEKYTKERIQNKVAVGNTIAGRTKLF